MHVNELDSMPRKATKQPLEPLGAIRNLMQWNPPLLGDLEGPPEELDLGPPFDVKETADTFVFLVDLPGMAQDELAIDLRPNRLTVSGDRKAEKLGEGENYYALERTFGAFTRSFKLPDGIDSNAVSAIMKDGVLTVNLPKYHETLPLRIPISDGH